MTTGWIAPDGPLLDDDLPPKVLRLPRTPDERLVANFLWRLAWNGDCLEWQGHIARNGYGVYRARYVHLFAFEFWFGSIPRKKLILHECDNGRCVSPYHLVAGTQAKNMSDKVARGRARGGRRPGWVGERSNFCLVSSRQAQQALDLAESGWWKAEIARRTGIPVGNVRNIVGRRSWRHLTPRAGLYPPPISLPSRWRRFKPGTKLP
jgi:hypothetical protein